MLCGRFVGFNSSDEPIGCGGAMVEITEEEANLIADSMR
jgi:hypothetical protein